MAAILKGGLCHQEENQGFACLCIKTTKQPHSFQSTISKAGKDNFTFYSLFPKDTPKLTTGTLLLLGQRYRFLFALKRRGPQKSDRREVHRFLQADPATQRKEVLGKKCSWPAQTQYLRGSPEPEFSVEPTQRAL